jgi:hypothetical protein
VCSIVLFSVAAILATCFTFGSTFKCLKTQNVVVKCVVLLLHMQEVQG